MYTDDRNTQNSTTVSIGAGCERMIKMKNRLVSAGLALLMILLALAAAFALPGNRKLLSQMMAPASASLTSHVSQTSWLLREYQGKIGVFAEGSDKPQQVLNVYISTLPQDDQQKLKKGIHASSREELLALIENYSS